MAEEPKTPKPLIRKVTIKNLQASVLKALGEKDELQERLDRQRVVLEDQRKALLESWGEARELRRRLDALASILGGAVQITHVPRIETGMASSNEEAAQRG